MILSICIPTLNRALYLKKNLNRLISIIDELNIIDKIEIVVSDNNSEDSTNSVLNEFKNLYSKRYNLLFWRQETRLVMQENLLFVVSKAQAKYFMWLGDDDFINKDYLSNSLDAIINKNVGLILPSYKFINNEGVLLNGGRDLNLKIAESIHGEVINLVV
jgi:abequosyltransferase